MKLILIQVVCFLLLVLNPSSVLTQDKVIIDSETRLPIDAVAVYIDGSSIGTVSNAQGKYSLSASEYLSSDLVFSHVGYDVRIILIDDAYFKLDTIELKPFILEAEKVEIVERVDPSVRKRRVRRFLNAFLGVNRNKNHVRVLNVDKILFEVKYGKLIATCNTPILIDNRVTGYRIQVSLEKFELFPDDKLIVKASTFFEPQDGTTRQVAKIKKNRRKLYFKSTDRFFKGIYDGEVSELEYIFGFSELVKLETFSFPSPLKVEDLKVERVDQELIKLYIENYFCVILKKIDIYPNLKEKNRRDGQTVVADAMQNARSILTAKSNYLLIDKNGRIKNSDETEEFGYWTTLRIADLLPFNYYENSTK